MKLLGGHDALFGRTFIRREIMDESNEVFDIGWNGLANSRISHHLIPSRTPVASIR